MKKERIKQLKQEGKKPIEISKELNLPLSTVRYHYDSKYKENQITRSKEYTKKNGDNRNKENFRKYQREYKKKMYWKLKGGEINGRKQKNEKL